MFLSVRCRSMLRSATFHDRETRRVVTKLPSTFNRSRKSCHRQTAPGTDARRNSWSTLSAISATSLNNQDAPEEYAPAPGRPPGKVEKSLCTTRPGPTLPRPGRLHPPQEALSDALFRRGSSDRPERQHRSRATPAHPSKISVPAGVPEMRQRPTGQAGWQRALQRGARPRP